MRELLGEGVPEAHVHGTLDLPLAQRRVDGLADVVDGDHPLDRTRLAIDDGESRGVPERSVDGRVGVLGIAEVLGPVDDVLTDVVDLRRAPARSRHTTGVADRTRCHQRAA